MVWQGIHGHDDVVQRFGEILAGGRLASSFLFVGPEGIGKRTFAKKLAQTLLCESNSEEGMNPCGTCPACQQVDATTHPDFEFVAKPKGKSFLPIELLIGDREHRMREGLCHNIALKPFRGGRKIAIIDDADFLNAEGANCLLKTLEEPPPKSMLILIGTSMKKQLPTILSRCQIIRFRPLASETAALLLGSHEQIADEDEARRLAELGQGSLQRALQFADQPLREFREELLVRLANLPQQSVSLAADIGLFVDSIGKDAPSRRERLKLVIEIAVEFYRELVRRSCRVASTADAALMRAAETALQSNNADVETTTCCLERCLEARSQVEANANQATLIECWIDDLT